MIRVNEDVLAIKIKYTRELWFASGKEVAKTIARAKLDQVSFSKTSLFFEKSQIFFFGFLESFVCSFFS
jgi:hypothetical protein